MISGMNPYRPGSCLLALMIQLPKARNTPGAENRKVTLPEVNQRLLECPSMGVPYWETPPNQVYSVSTRPTPILSCA